VISSVISSLLWVVVGWCGQGAFWVFSVEHNDDYDDDHDGTRMIRIKRIKRIKETMVFC